MPTTEELDTTGSPGVLLTLVPGPDRKRTQRVYRYVIRYRNVTLDTPGCVMTWEVIGGREPYQIALERDETDRFRWHCTCPDAVYRGDDHPHQCKHVRGLLNCLPKAILGKAA